MPMTLCLILTFSSTFIPATRMPVFQLPWLNRKEAKLAALTPGRVATRCSICWNMEVIRGSLFFSPVTAESIWRRSTPSRFEAGINVVEVYEATDKQDRTHHQDERDGDLSGDECFAERTS